MNSNLRAVLAAICLAACLSAAGCHGDGAVSTNDDHHPSTKGTPTYSHTAGALHPFAGNWMAKAFALHMFYTFDPMQPKEHGSYWIMFEGQYATASNDWLKSQLDCSDVDTSADFVLSDGSAYVKIDAVKTKDEGPKLHPKPWPIVITQQIRVGAQGTEFIVQNDSNASADHSVQRVFLLDTPLAGHSLVVLQLHTSTVLSTLTQMDHYSEFTNGKCTVDNKLTPDDLKKQIQYIRDKADKLCK